MSTPFLGEIRMFGFSFPPKGWALCQGQILPINQNQALFSLLGTTYGGNGQTNFALPNLSNRAPMHVNFTNGTHPQGEQAGEATHTLSIAEMPTHTHQVSGRDAATAVSPAGARWASAPKAAYGDAPDALMSAAAVSLAGNGTPHENRPPYLTVNFAIALQGIFPSRN